ncbi:hypothetical protein LUZ60_002588 [Juncus effusus]|nr:hypothetical protein LUZ60_002588 [Juncus effusus]
MAEPVRIKQMMHAALPYTVMTLKSVSNVGLMTILRSTLDPVYGVKSVVLTVYQQLASASVLCFLALLFDHGRRKRPSFQILSWTFLIGFLQITTGEILLTTSLKYITATVQSVGLNMIPVGVFILAVLAGREKFHFCDFYGQAKLFGVLASTVGATIVVLVSNSDTDSESINTGFWIGVLMVALAVLTNTIAALLVEKVAIEFSSDITLSAMMTVFGTLQTFIVALFMERDLSSWKINTKSPELLSIFYGGIIVTGVFYLGSNWCVHKKGPVFSSSFSPLLVVFSFLVEIFLGSETYLASVIGAILVIGGLYLLLWAKSRDNKEKISQLNENDISESSCTDPLIVQNNA